VTPLKDSIRVLNGFELSLESILPKIKYSYLVEDSGEALRLAGRYAHAFFLTPEGECFHNATVTGGKPSSEGPLALKRELREAENRLGKLEIELAQAETEAAALVAAIAEQAAQLEALSEQRRLAERDTANQGAALKQMEGETQRVERRLEEWTTQAARNKDAREAKSVNISQKREEMLRLEAEHRTAEAALDQLQAELALLRQTRESLQQEAAQVTAELAGLEERRRGAEVAFQRIDRLHADLERRVQTIAQQRTAADAEREQRVRESAELTQREQELASARAEALALAQTLAGQAQVCACNWRPWRRNSRADGPRWMNYASSAPAAPVKAPSCSPTSNTWRQAAWPRSMRRPPRCAPMNRSRVWPARSWSRKRRAAGACVKGSSRWVR
jgi:chromosome segregation protein